MEGTRDEDIPAWVLRQKLTAIWAQLLITHHELADDLAAVLHDDGLWLPLLTHATKV